MDFLSMKTRVAEETGLDLTTDATKLGVWINEAYRFISGLRNWPWLLKNAVLQTVQDITTLTASVNAAGTAVTLSATYATSVANDYMIQFAFSDDWYLITAHTAGSASLTISPGYLGTTNLTSGTCTIRRIYYSLATDVDRLINFRQAVNDKTLALWDIRDYDHNVPDPDTTGDPSNVVLAGLDSNKYWRIILDPIPEDKINIHYRYYQRVADLTGTDTPILPETWHQVIPLIALATYGHMYIDDSRVNQALARSKDVIREMIQSVDITPTKTSVIQAWDQRIAPVPGRPRFPSNYDIRWSL